jgi:hypothetical protein
MECGCRSFYQFHFLSPRKKNTSLDVVYSGDLAAMTAQP